MQYNSSYKILESKPQEIISLESVKNYMRIMHDNDDSLILDIIESAISATEDFIKYSLTQKIVEAITYNCKVIVLPILPVFKILEVKADDKIVQEGDFSLGKNSVILDKFPKIQKLVVSYIAGYEIPTKIPASIKQGIFIHISSIYDNRGNPDSFNDRIFDIYKPYRKMMV